MARTKTPLERAEYLARAHEFAPRGQDLPYAKLLDIDVISIRSAERQRNNLRKYIRDNLSNDALAKTYNVHPSTIDRILRHKTWNHLA